MNLKEFVLFPQRHLILLLLILFSFFDAQLRGTPVFTRTQFLISIIGLVYYMGSKGVYGVKKFIKFGIGVLCCCLLTSVINMQFDTWVFQHYFLTNIIYIYGWYLIVRLAVNNGLRLEEIFHLVVFSIVINNTIALMYFIAPTFSSILLSLQEMSFSYSDSGIVSRLYGIGMAGTNYGGGVSTSIGLILTMYLLYKKYLREGAAILVYIYLTFSGMLIARTTMVGVCASLLGYAFLSNNIFKAIKFTVPILVLFLCVVICFMISWKDTLLFEHTFALFLNYFNGDGFTDGSMDALLERHWAVMPDNFKTWLLGDGHLTDGAGYYKHTDVGYLRSIFCIGICGTAYYWIGLLSTTVSSLKHVRSEKDIMKLFFIFYIFILVLNAKGLSDDLAHVFWIPVIYFSFKRKGPIIR